MVFVRGADVANGGDEASPWSVGGAEELLGSLTGILSARVVAKPGGAIDEIHVLTNHDVAPKQTVRNIESALRAHFDLDVDHRKISVAQSSGEAGGGESIQMPSPARGDSRILFVGHEVESDRSHQLRIAVDVEWDGHRYRGEALGADLPRPRLETVANATLRAVEAAVGGSAERNGSAGLSLALDGTKVVEAFDRRHVLVAVHALVGRNVVPLSASTPIEDSTDKAVILAVLQATDRWTRGRM